MRTIINRLLAETPRFFQLLRNIALAVSAACTSASVFYAQLPVEVTATVPESLVKMLALAGMTAAFIAQLTRVDSPTQP